MKTFFLALALFFSSTVAFAAETTNLYGEWSSKGQVKIFVVEPLPAQGKKADVVALKKELEKALQNRKSIRFVIAPDKAAADLVVESQVLDFYWTDHDPVDMLMGAASIAYDAATIENYARMDANFKVSDKNGKKLWEDKLAATLTSKTLTEAESPTKINEEMAKVFVRDVFGKRRS